MEENKEKKEKKQIKISLGTAICIFLIIILVAAMVGTVIYYNKVQQKNNISKENDTNDTEVNTIETEENEKIDEYKEEEGISNELESNESYVGTWKINYIKRKRK